MIPRCQLGGYLEYRPPPMLTEFSEAWWFHRTTALLPESAPRAHRVLPDPAVSVAFSCCRDSRGRPGEPRLFLIGPTIWPRLFQFTPGAEITAVRLKLEWVRPLLALAPFEHANAELELATVAAPLARCLWTPLLATRSAEEAVAVLGAALARRRSDARVPEREAAALELIRAHPRVPIKLAAERAGVSVRQLRRLLRTQVGVGLKTFARTHRLLAAVAAADRCPGRLSWAMVAAQTGFADQSHLVREFHDLCGLTPGNVVRERRAQVGPDGRNVQSAEDAPA